MSHSSPGTPRPSIWEHCWHKRVSALSKVHWSRWSGGWKRSHHQWKHTQAPFFCLKLVAFLLSLDTILHSMCKCANFSHSPLICLKNLMIVWNSWNFQWLTIEAGSKGIPMGISIIIETPLLRLGFNSWCMWGLAAAWQEEKELIDKEAGVEAA